MNFDIDEICESCRKLTRVSDQGICQKCFQQMVEARSNPAARKERLRKINQSAGGLISSAKRYANQDPSTYWNLKERPDNVLRALRAKPKELTAARDPNLLTNELGLLNGELVSFLRKNPGAMHELSPRRFEELTCEILRDMGCETHLTPCTRDGGRDILASFKTPFGSFLTIVECKRFRPDLPVGIDLIERFLWVIERKDKASSGLFVTSSYFSPQVLATAREFQYKLALADFGRLQEWISAYGSWTTTLNGDLWIPRSPTNR